MLKNRINKHYIFIKILFYLIGFYWIFFIDNLIEKANILNYFFLLLGLAIGIVGAMRGYLYSSMFFLFHLIFLVIFIWIYINIDLIDTYDIYNYSVFNADNLRSAIHTLVSTCLVNFFLYNIVQKNTRSVSVKESFKDLFLFGLEKKGSMNFFIFFLVLSFLLDLLYLTNTTILDVSYPSQTETQWIPYQLYKIPLYFSSLAAIFMVLQLALKDITLVNKVWFNIAILNFIFSCVVLLLIAGSRGFVTFILFFFSGVSLSFFRKWKGFFLCGVLFFLFMLLVYLLWPILRVNLSYIPLLDAFKDSIDTAIFFSSAKNKINYSDITKLKLSDIQMVGQSVFHFLYVIQLVNNNVSLEGSTFANLIPQFIPSFFDGVFGFERPINDNYRLGEYYNHGGGFFTLANAYWNGGMVVALIFSIAVTLFFIWFDRCFFSKNFGAYYRFVYVILFPPMIIQMAYGVQGLMRIIEALVFMIFINKILKIRNHHYLTAFKGAI